MMTKLTDLSFDMDTLGEGYAKKAFTVTDIVRESLRRINSGDPAIWITVDSEANLLAAAKKLDSIDPSSLPLYGIPFAVKDNIDVENLPTTAACPDFKHFPENDATVIANLRTAGALPIGKTNLDQFATGLVGVRSPYGIPRNPFNAHYIPGGSSSGSAVSVSLGQVSFSLGTDTAGSGRVPACYNNLIGLKPSRGIISSTGLIPACRSLDCISIFALNAGDAQTAFQAAVSFDAIDPYSRENEPATLIPTGTFGVPDPSQLAFFGNTLYLEGFLAAKERLERLGFRARVIDFSPFIQAAKLLYEGPWVAERYWATQEIVENSPESLHPTTRSIIEKGNRHSAVETFDAMYQLQGLKILTETTLKKVDFALSPTVGTHYTIEEVEKDPIALNTNLGFYTNFMNLLDLSAVATPTAILDDGLPFGVTLFARAFSDDYLLSVADRLHRASDLPLGAGQARRYRSLAPIEAPTMPIAVCGAHMSNLPLNSQLTDLKSTFVKRCQTASCYRLFALPNTEPPKPGLIRDPSVGASIEVEVWNLPKANWGAFLDLIPPPLGIANIELDDGTCVKGFACEAWALESAEEVTHLGGWRNYLKTLTQNAN